MYRSTKISIWIFVEVFLVVLLSLTVKEVGNMGLTISANLAVLDVYYDGQRIARGHGCTKLMKAKALHDTQIVAVTASHRADKVGFLIATNTEFRTSANTWKCMNKSDEYGDSWMMPTFNDSDWPQAALVTTWADTLTYYTRCWNERDRKTIKASRIDPTVEWIWAADLVPHSSIMCRARNKDYCKVNVCKNGGTCQNIVGDFICKCLDAYTGYHCEYKKDVCKSSPCRHGTCEKLHPKYLCHCDEHFTGTNCDRCLPGFTGQNCRTPIDHCAGIQCQNNGTCVNRTTDFECVCESINSGRFCEVDYVGCLTHPCIHGGTCQQLEPKANYSCQCDEGFTGANCEADLFRHTSSLTDHMARCIKKKYGRFLCICHRGYTGIHCETDIDDCKSSPCPRAAACVDSVEGYACVYNTSCIHDDCAEEVLRPQAQAIVARDATNAMTKVFVACLLVAVVLFILIAVSGAICIQRRRNMKVHVIYSAQDSTQGQNGGQGTRDVRD